LKSAIFVVIHVIVKMSRRHFKQSL